MFAYLAFLTVSIIIVGLRFYILFYFDGHFNLKKNTIIAVMQIHNNLANKHVKQWHIQDQNT